MSSSFETMGNTIKTAAEDLVVAEDNVEAIRALKRVVAVVRDSSCQAGISFEQLLLLTPRSDGKSCCDG